MAAKLYDEGLTPNLGPVGLSSSPLTQYVMKPLPVSSSGPWESGAENCQAVWPGTPDRGKVIHDEVCC
jgi:hypothetical protein